MKKVIISVILGIVIVACAVYVGMKIMPQKVPVVNTGDNDNEGDTDIEFLTTDYAAVTEVFKDEVKNAVIKYPVVKKMPEPFDIKKINDDIKGIVENYKKVLSDYEITKLELDTSVYETQNYYSFVIEGGYEIGTEKHYVIEPLVYEKLIGGKLLFKDIVNTTEDSMTSLNEFLIDKFKDDSLKITEDSRIYFRGRDVILVYIKDEDSKLYEKLVLSIEDMQGYLLSK